MEIFSTIELKLSDLTSITEILVSLNFALVGFDIVVRYVKNRSNIIDVSIPEPQYYFLKKENGKWKIDINNYKGETNKLN